MKYYNYSGFYDFKTFIEMLGLLYKQRSNKNVLFLTVQPSLNSLSNHKNIN